MRFRSILLRQRVRRQPLARGNCPIRAERAWCSGGSDGKELYYLAADRAVMAVEVTGGATPQFAKPKVLFRPPADIVPGIGSGKCQRQP